MLINCDLGESDDLLFLTQQNHTIMPMIDLANIACGGHRGNEESMSLCIQHCLEYQVKIGAHPSYPDCANFGRVSMQDTLSLQQLEQSLMRQIEALMNCCHTQKTTLSHIKPHGALYHDCQKNLTISKLLGDIAKNFNLPLILSFPNSVETTVSDYFQQNGNIIWHEAFADRGYQEDGSLLPRLNNPNAILTEMKVRQQYRHLVENNSVKVGNKWLNLKIDTICFHSDQPASVAFLSST